MRRAIAATLLALLLTPLRSAAAQTPSAPVVFPQLGDDGLITALAFTKDGRTLASGDQERKVKLFDVQGGREIRTLSGAGGGVNALAISPDGETIAAASEDRTVRLWKRRTGEAIGVLAGAEDAVTAVAYSPDGAFLAAITRSGVVRVWKVREGQEPQLVTRFGDGPPHPPPSAGSVSAFLGDMPLPPPPGLAYTAGGGALITASASAIDLRAAADGAALSSFKIPGFIAAWTVSPDSRLLVVAWTPPAVESTKKPLGTGDPPIFYVTVYEVATGRLVRTLKTSYSLCSALALSPGGKILAWSDGLGVHLMDGSTGKALQTIPSHSFGGPPALAFAPDGQALADSELDLISTADGQTLRSFAGRVTSATSIAFAPDGRTLRALNFNAVRTWSQSTGRKVGEVAFADARHPNWSGEAFSPDGSVIVGTSDANWSLGTNLELWDVKSATNLELWDAKSGRRLFTLAAGTNDLCAAFSADGAELASCPDGQRIDLFDVRSGRLVRTLAPEGRYDLIQSVAFSPDRSVLAVLYETIGPDTRTSTDVQLWNLASGRRQRAFLGEGDQVSYSRTGRFLALTREGGGAVVWEVATGRKMEFKAPRRWGAEGGSVFDVRARTSLAWSSDDARLALGADDGSIRLVDTAAGNIERELKSAAAVVTSLAMSPDGAVLAAAYSDGVIREWDLAAGKERVDLIAFENGSSIAITPEGYFDSSGPSAEAQLNVRVGDRVFAVGAYRERFYRPELLKQAMTGGSLGGLATLADEALPPVIEVASPPKVTSKATLEVSARITDAGGGVGWVWVYLNNSLVKTEPNPPRGSGAVLRTYELPLVDGPNEIKLVAFNAADTVQSETQVFQVTANLRAPQPATLYALVLGVQSFPRGPADYNQLTTPVADAELFAAALSKYAAPLFSHLDVRVLTTLQGAPAEASPTKANIQKALSDIKRVARPGDEFIFYVASHAVVANGVYYILATDFDPTSPGALRQGALSKPELMDLLANAATRKLAVLDTCHAGAMQDALPLDRAMDNEASSKLLSEDLGSTVLSAATTEQEAIDSYRGHGLFTFVVVDGLSGKAPANSHGAVTNLHLAAYVDDTVGPLALNLYRHQQTPVVAPNGRTFEITKAPSPSAP